MGQSEVALQFLNSPDYLASHPDPSSYLTGLYSDILGRSPDRAGATSWTPWLFLPFGRVIVADGVLNSLEEDRRIVDVLYGNLLNRRFDSKGEQFWIRQLTQGGLAIDEVAVGFLATVRRGRRRSD